MMGGETTKTQGAPMYTFQYTNILQYKKTVEIILIADYIVVFICDKGKYTNIRLVDRSVLAVQM